MPRTKKSKTVESVDIHTEIANLRQQYLVAKMKLATGELKTPHVLKAQRRGIARLMTKVNASK